VYFSVLQNLYTHTYMQSFVQATHSTTLQHTATHSTTLQHTATHDIHADICTSSSQVHIYAHPYFICKLFLSFCFARSLFFFPLCIQTHAHTHTHICTHVRTHVCTHAHTHSHTPTHRNTHISMCQTPTLTHIPKSTHAPAHMHLSVYTHAYISADLEGNPTS